MEEREAIARIKASRDYRYSHYAHTDDDGKAFDMAIKALEKQIAKKPVKSENRVVRYVNTYYCPICNLGITGTNIAKWCYHCGQKLDWSDVD